MDNPISASYKFDIEFITYSILWDMFVSSDFNLVNIAVAVFVVHSN